MGNVQSILEHLARYGLVFVFIIVFLEYLNFPGLGSAVVMPAIGVGALKFNINIFLAILISILAANLASYVLFYISYFFGKPLLTRIYNKFPKSRKSIDKTFNYIENYGYKGVLIARLIPVVRTLIPFVAGMFKMNVFKFTIYSTIGIVIWNTVLIYIGYAFAHLFI